MGTKAIAVSNTQQSKITAGVCTIQLSSLSDERCRNYLDTRSVLSRREMTTANYLTTVIFRPRCQKTAT